MRRAAAAAAVGVIALALAACEREPGQAAATESVAEAGLAMLDELEARLDALDATVAAIADQHAILDNELQYTRGLDRHDEALIGDAFWADARASYGTLVDIDELPRWANDSHAMSAAHQHHVTTLMLDVDGDTAHEEGYILFSSDAKRDTSFDTPGEPTPGRIVGGSTATLGTGRYVNRYERRDGEWRMIVHEYVHDVSLPLEAVDLCATGCLGTWDRTDVSYLRPLQPMSAEERGARMEQGTMPRAAALPASSGTEGGAE